MTAAIPIVFIHQGASWFLPYALNQAKHVDPHAPLILLGDGSGPAGVRSEKLSNLESDLTAKFRSVFKPMTKNPPEFELMCYLRWFYLLGFMRREGLQEVLYFDSDVLLYTEGAKIRRKVLQAGKQCGFAVAEQPFELLNWVACGHGSYWTAAMLEEFCQFSIRTYSEDHYLSLYRRKIENHLRTSELGGISDMATFYLFWTENQDRVLNLCSRNAGSALDLNIVCETNDAKETYVTENGRKKITFIDGQPHFHLLGTNEVVRADAIHFQGARKDLMPKFYTGRRFPGKVSSELRLKIRMAKKSLRATRKKFFKRR